MAELLRRGRYPPRSWDLGRSRAQRSVPLRQRAQDQALPPEAGGGLRRWSSGNSSPASRAGTRWRSTPMPATATCSRSSPSAFCEDGSARDPRQRPRAGTAGHHGALRRGHRGPARAPGRQGAGPGDHEAGRPPQRDQHQVRVRVPDPRPPWRATSPSSPRSGPTTWAATATAWCPSETAGSLPTASSRWTGTHPIRSTGRRSSE